MPEDDDAAVTAERRRAWLPNDETTLRMMIREEVRAGMADFAADPRCPRPCAQMVAVEAVVFGKDEDNQAGLAERMRNVESYLGKVSRLTWIALGSAVTGSIGLIFSLIAVYMGK